MKTKICNKCKKELPITEFHKDKYCKGGIRNKCKQCNCKEAREYYKIHIEKKKKYDKNYRKIHKKQIAKRMKVYNKSNKGILRQQKYWQSKRGLTKLVWWGMKKRCNNPNHINYKSYGGKGIKICDRWLGKKGFNNFVKDMGYRPSIDYVIHRLDSYHNYCPENCEWILKIKHRKIHNK